MDNAFFKAFNTSLPAAGKVMGEKWMMGGVEYDAISVDEVSATDRAMAGGKLDEVSVVMVVSKTMVAMSGVKKGSVITVRGAQVRVGPVGNDGDASVTLNCGPAGVDVRR